MAWEPMFVPFLVTLLLYFLPGSLVLLALGQRLSRVAVLAPLVSVGLVSSLAVVYGSAHIGFSTGKVLLGSVGVAVIAFGLRCSLTLPRKQPFRQTAAYIASRSESLRLLVAAALGLIVCVVVWVFSYARPMRTPNNFPQPYDVPFHFSVIKFLVDSNNGSSLTAALVDQTSGPSFYPAAWHDIVALVVRTTNTSIPVAVAASCTVILVAIWPLAIMAFTTQILGMRARWVFFSLALSGLFQTFPYLFVSYGVLYSNLLSFALLPAFMALVMDIFSSRRSLADHVSQAIVLVVGLVAIALAQPNSLFTVVVLLLPFVIRFLFGIFAGIHSAARRWTFSGVTSAAVIAVSVIGWITLYNSPALQRTVTFNWPPFQTDAQAIGTYVMSASNGERAQYVMTALVLTGIVIAFSRAGHRWIVVSWALMGALYTITTSDNGDFRMILTGFWYHDSNRLLAAAPMMAVPLACSGLSSLSQFLISRSPRPRSIVRWGTPVVLTLLVVALTGVSPAMRAQRTHFHDQTVRSEQWPLTQYEYDFLAQVSSIVPPGEGVANNPYDGSAFAYSLFGINVYFKDYDANWIGLPTPDIDTVRHELNQASSNREVCQVLAKRDVRYVVVLSMNAINTGTGIGVNPMNWAGLQVTDSTPGFKVLLQDDRGNRLYEISACGT